MNLSNAARNRMWDLFVDYCFVLDLDPNVEDFDAWAQQMVEDQALAEQDRCERDARYRALYGME